MIFSNLVPIAALAAFVASPAPGVGPSTVPVVAAPSVAPAPTADPLAYDDPAVHFRAPDGWKRVDLSGAPNDPSGKSVPAAVFYFARDRTDARSIVIQIEPFAGTLDGLVHARESELRSASEGTFVDHETKVTLANGMPAYLVQTSQPGGAVGHQVRRYDYIVYDLQRSIDVAYIGRYGDFDERDVRAAFASLSVVVYPRRR